MMAGGAVVYFLSDAIQYDHVIQGTNKNVQGVSTNIEDVMCLPVQSLDYWVWIEDEDEFNTRLENHKIASNEYQMQKEFEKIKQQEMINKQREIIEQTKKHLDGDEEWR